VALTSDWPDSELIAGSSAEPAMFSEIFDRHHAELYRYLRRRVGPGLAADLAADTFVTAFARRGAYRRQSTDARPWLYGIAHNLLRNHLRGRLFAAESEPPPALRSALYRAAAMLPGITLIGPSRDLIGRAATEVYLPPDAVDRLGTALFFDPDTGAVLSEEDFYPYGARCSSPLMGWAALASGYVSSNDQLPPGASGTVKPVVKPTFSPACQR